MKKLLALAPLLPIAELVGFIVIGGRLGLARSLGLLFLAGVLGAAVMRLAGMSVMRSFQQALVSGRPLDASLITSMLLLVAGGLLLFPGFVSDAIGLVLLLPPVRAAIARRVAGRPGGFGRGAVIDVEPGPER